MGFLKSFSGLYKCLYCIWPALVIGIGWWFSRIVNSKTYYGSLTPGVDPASPQGQAEFDTSRQRNAEKRRIIYICAGVIALGYVGALLANTFTLGMKASPNPTATNGTVTASINPTSAFTNTETFTPVPSVSATPSFTPTLASPTYQRTATNRVVYVAGPQVTVVVTVLVTRIVTAKPTRTPTPTQTLTPTPMLSPTETFTPSETVPVY